MLLMDLQRQVLFCHSDHSKISPQRPRGSYAPVHPRSRPQGIHSYSKISRSERRSRALYICFRVNLPPPWYGPPRPWPRAHRPTTRLCKAACLPYWPLFPHLVKFPANTMQINTSCKDYDPINQHSHQSTRTTGPQGGRGANHDHAQGGGGGGATLEHICKSIYMSKSTWINSFNQQRRVAARPAFPARAVRPTRWMYLNKGLSFFALRGHVSRVAGAPN